jgi:gas vesicle protein
MSRESGSGDFVAGFVFGAFVGAVLALLFAPSRGEELRDQIREKSIELKDRAGDLTADARREAETLRARGQSVFKEQKTRFQEAIDEGREAAARRKEELLAQLDTARSNTTVLEPSEDIES